MPHCNRSSSAAPQQLALRLRAVRAQLLQLPHHARLPLQQPLLRPAALLCRKGAQGHEAWVECVHGACVCGWAEVVVGNGGHPLRVRDHASGARQRARVCGLVWGPNEHACISISTQ